MCFPLYILSGLFCLEVLSLLPLQCVCNEQKGRGKDIRERRGLYNTKQIDNTLHIVAEIEITPICRKKSYPAVNLR